MGWRWEVAAWTKGVRGYEWEIVWTGESFGRALLAMRRAKKGVGAVRLVWR